MHYMTYFNNLFSKIVKDLPSHITPPALYYKCTPYLTAINDMKRRKSYLWILKLLSGCA